MGFRIIVVEPALGWIHELRKSDREALAQIAAALDVLQVEGPALGRPLVDRVAGSNLPNLKELRPGSRGSTEVRLLFAFDPARNAVVLVGGDKSGNWTGWYRTAVKAAEAAYQAYLKEES
ncbi:type II toxin-antitoxin system RelE/ParE family toxin [Streptomyces sp. B-S-A8]|uniref:Type II toxin-antitoxin system RelE/ParE family toxin n=1 Tax=Streptomyces solicavernae TaxID=3043614 RepID=A0ABT6RZJ4_9ACTN|nr:type II toxin-antitoxin system RelE/ParE family toxin [Streptomyces sp. B-S-A8]MDI3389848.1 type II toxin-antitoxin system RelE/ParE family toxin [Streptomyces sp. B-S-A8]